MATISSAGIGSGLDVSAIVDKLVAIERTPIEALQTKATTIQTKLSSFGLLSSYMTNVGDIAAALAKPDLWSQTTASSSDPAAVSIGAAAGAAAGAFAVEVSQLAQPQGLASQAYADKAAIVGTGSLRIEVGSWNADATVFTADAVKPPVNIAIGAGEGSLESIKSRINAAGAGVTASIVSDAGGARLVLRSSATGTAGALRITATDDDGNDADAAGLSALAYDPPAATAGQLTQTQAPRDALATVNGLAVTSPTNTLAGAIEGVTLTLNKVTVAPVDLKVAIDTAAQRTAVKAFAKAFSDVNTYIATQTKYDAVTKKAAALQGDRATLGLQSTLRSLMQSPTSASGTYARLSDIGIEAQRDGTFTVNETKLGAALANPAELAKFFGATAPAAPAQAASPQGYGVRAKALATQLAGSDGLITTTTKGLRDSIVRNSDAQQTLEDRVALTKARLTKQYSALDTTMSRISASNGQLTQSLNALSSLMTSIANGK